MKTNSVKSIARFAVVLMVLSIIPSGAFAAEDEISADEMTRAGPGNMMKERMGQMGPGMGPAGMSGMGMVPLDYADEDYFSEIQTAMLERLDRQIERMSNMSDIPELEDLPEGVDEEKAAAKAEERAEANAGKLAELEALYSEIEDATSLDDLKAIALSHAKDGVSDSIARDIEKFTKMQENLGEIENEDVTDELLTSTIADLTTLQEQVDSAEDREALQEIGGSVREIMESFREEAGIKQRGGPMGREGPGTSMKMQVRMPRAEAEA
ncbi:hypothetical protein MSMTP_1785 [Methanosarcina sp. MTP4]|uniref:hypothetical protein n=1 Tax=Methanosarcina sp. MTP4 TaxID=1434100 RepID=UPI0006158CD2|nr:hypothetical protein [Methanosarcina sp. MTP4]AKB25254.1 hypothetical protein MSMTP_1785 [Methanosarcina sp. MTP4]